MSVMRVIVAGTVGAGKSTLVQTAGEIGVVSTEEIATDRTAMIKPKTTVALDFSRVTLPQNTDAANHTLHLYGTPGQYRFNFMWEILLQTAQLGFVLVAAHRPEDLLPTHRILEFIERCSANCTRKPLPLTIGLTHTDCSGALSIQDVSAHLGSHASTIVAINPRDRASVINALAIAVDRLSQSRS